MRMRLLLFPLLFALLILLASCTGVSDDTSSLPDVPSAEETVNDSAPASSASSEMVSEPFQEDTVPRVYLTCGKIPESGNGEAAYASGEFSLSVGTEKQQENLPMQIKIRGNSTRSFPKLSYRIKLDSKADVLGMGEARNWVLLANYADKSLVRNIAAFRVAELMSVPYTPELRTVELWLNDEYIGVYTIGEMIEAKSERVDIENHSTADDTGYLLECDVRAADEDRAYFSVSEMLFSILSPEPATLSQQQYIQSKITQIDTLLRQNDDSVWEILDMESCANWLISKEICGGTGMGYDAYLFCDKGGKIHFGPVWDYDLAFGNADFGEADRWDRFYLCNMQWMELWLQNDTFRAFFMERLTYAQEKVLPQIDKELQNFTVRYADCAERNFERWDILTSYVWPNPSGVMAAQTFPAQVNYVRAYLQKHAAWMASQFT